MSEILDDAHVRCQRKPTTEAFVRGTVSGRIRWYNAGMLSASLAMFLTIGGSSLPTPDPLSQEERQVWEGADQNLTGRVALGGVLLGVGSGLVVGGVLTRQQYYRERRKAQESADRETPVVFPVSGFSKSVGTFSLLIGSGMVFAGALVTAISAHKLRVHRKRVRVAFTSELVVQF